MAVNNMGNRQKSESSFGATIIAALCIVIYLFALVQATVRLYLSIDNQKITADMEFAQMANLALSAGAQGFMSESFIETMNRALSSASALESLIISGPDGSYAFERHKDYVVTWINNSPRFINKFGYTSQSLHRALPIQNLRNTNIQGIARLFNYAEMTKILKETLFLILIGFTIAFFTMLVQLLRSKPAEIQTEEKPIEPVVSVQDDMNEVFDVSGGPKGLYSPRSNIGWEEYTKDRLDSELHRCASTEKDLTLLIIEFSDELHDIQFKQAAEEVASFFTSRDLLFEKGRQGISVICPGVDLETGLDKAQKFQQRINEKIFFNHDANKSIYIGISSRAGRLLNAGRLLLETNEALSKAKIEQDTSIMAFKSDPEKYRKFIASQSPTHS